MEQRILPTTTVEKSQHNSNAKDHRKLENAVINKSASSKTNTNRVPSSDSHEKSNVTTNSTSDEADYDSLTPATIKKTVLELLRPYNDKKRFTLSNKIDIKRPTRKPCEAPQNINLQCYKDLFHGIPFYTEENVGINDSMLNRVQQLAIVLSGLATSVFNTPVILMKLYRDADTHSLLRIGFHYNHSLYFNIRYFESTFAEILDLKVTNAGNNDSNKHDIINFYFMKSCHLLVHNVHVDHNIKFIRALEDTVIKFLPAKDSFLQQFKFS
ncbi:unnamed protein product [Rotaria sp. Silwood1]|nr:unnamed protein product [Rotaria sp. Silwood1]CAF1661564.1 unnamed protein product [Rotaria sp. Silwood1]